MTEGEFWTKRVKPLLSKIPCSVWERINDKSKRGIPDVIGCVNGCFVALELKRSHKESLKVSGRIVLQKYVISKYVKQGLGIGFIVHPDNLIYVYEEIIKLTDSVSTG